MDDNISLDSELDLIEDLSSDLEDYLEDCATEITDQIEGSSSDISGYIEDAMSYVSNGEIGKARQALQKADEDYSSLLSAFPDIMDGGHIDKIKDILDRIKPPVVGVGKLPGL